MTRLRSLLASSRSRVSCCLLLAIVLTLACAGAAKADTFSNGEFVTYTQTDWSTGGAGASFLSTDYNSVYASTNEVLIVGAVGLGLFNIAFTGASDVLSYIPTAGTPEALTASLLNPSSNQGSVFSGDVVALTLNIDFSNAGLLGTSSVPFGGLALRNFGGSLSGLDGLTVSQFLAIANICLGDGSCPEGLNNIATITGELNVSFDGGTVQSGFFPSCFPNECTFANTYLALPSTPAPEPSSFLLLAPALAGLGLLRRAKNCSKENAA